MADSCTVDGDEMLVALVEQHSLLYDKSSDDYKNKDKKRDAWIEIASEMFHLTQTSTEVKDLVNKWNTLKRKFMDERRKVTAYIPSGSSAPVIRSQWKYYEAMKFLEKHVQHRRTVSNFQNAAYRIVDEDDDEEDDDEEDDDEEDEEVVEIIDSEEFEDSQEDGLSSERLDAPTLAHSRRPVEINNYLLVFRDAWRRIPERNRRKCFFKLRAVIRSKKQNSAPRP